jgi:circadian clock protein KaiC
MTTPATQALRKAATGIPGLDEITQGGLPKGRPTLLCGASGCGKTLFAIEFLVHGAVDHNEPGVFVMFEENADELATNVRSLGFDLQQLVADKKLILDHVHVERSEIDETGEYDLEGLFIRLDHAVKKIGAKRIVLDTLEALFAGLPNEAVLRSELRRLFRWIKDQGLTAVITGERGDGTLTRYGLEEYVADCVILLDHRVRDQVSTRRLRIVKYRGSPHGTNEYPFIISSDGISVLPITSLLLDHTALPTRVPTGVPSLDALFEGGGYHKGSSILVTGAAGSLKTSLAMAFLDAACARGERCVLFAYEESASQIMRNMLSVGVDLQRWVDSGLLHIHASRPTLTGLEQHLVMMYRLVLDLKAEVVVVDPVSNLSLDPDQAVKPMLMRLIDHLKAQGVTGLFTSLTSAESAYTEDSEVGVSSLMDTWLMLRNVELDGERERALVILKSRGTAHSHGVHRLTIGAAGLELQGSEVWKGAGHVDLHNKHVPPAQPQKRPGSKGSTTDQ